jgi:ribonuclease HI
MKDLHVFADTKTDNKIYVFTDGGCQGNGKKNAKAGYAIYFPGEDYHDFTKSGHVISEPTNQKAELTAILRLFEILNENQDKFVNNKVIVCTDSMYSINCIEKWSKTWEKNDWKNSKGEVVKNKEIIEKILQLRKVINIDIEFKHVFSHLAEPKDKNSSEYFFWYGNHKVDNMISQIFSN